MFDPLPDENPDLAAQIPFSILEGLRGYARYGYPIGHFLTAVLSNDLFGAVGRADDVNRNRLPEICQYVWNCMPAACHGSPEAVRGWVAAKERELELV